MIFKLRCAFVLSLSVISVPALSAEFSGMVQVNTVFTDDSVRTWQDEGTGVLRYDSSGINLQQAILHIDQELPADFSLSIDANAYSDGEQKLGFTQAQLHYKPLSNKNIRFRARAGAFYPKYSVENVDIGWTSPFTYTQSALNAWVGEELRVFGAEATLFSNTKKRKSPWSWQVHGAVFKGNDPLGAIITWRGFATHDRQSLNNDRVNFAPLPSVISPDLIDNPQWVEPFHEIDGRLGVYVGAHVNYQHKSQLRAYYYDNRADPTVINSQGQYAWHTTFTSLSLSHKFSKSTRLLSQYMVGTTEMGERFVYADFESWYAMLSHTIEKHRLSVRYDHFNVMEDDIFPTDINNSNGQAFTLNWRYNINRNWQVGAEFHINENTAYNRPTLGIVDPKVTQEQAIFVLQYKWK